MSAHAQESTAVSFTPTIVGSPQPTFMCGSNLNGVDPMARQASDSAASASSTDTYKLPDTIPPEHDHRTLVVCFDGTGDQFDADNSNIVQLVSLLKKNDRNKQMVYYQAGIGTYISPKVATPFTSKISKILDQMVAWNLDAHLMSMIASIANVPQRLIALLQVATSSLCKTVGLLPRDNHQQVPFAYKMYTRASDQGWEQSNAFKLAFSIPVKIDFLGVWDTVDSVGLIPKRLPFTTSNTIVRTFRHAISLDERRAKFKPNFWNRPTEDELALGIHTVRIPTPEPVHKNQKGHKASHPSRQTTSKDEQKLSTNEKIFTEKDKSRNTTPTDIEEVWFAGCHCDVGGGSVDNKIPSSLARIPLRWMVRECFKANTGIMFNTDALRTIGLDPATLYPHVLPRPPPRLDPTTFTLEKRTDLNFFQRIAARRRAKANAATSLTVTVNDQSAIDEELEDMKDAMSPIFDQLDIKYWWWILEILPLNLRYQNGNNEWISNFRSNLANPRFIPKQHTRGVKVHRSVKLRMDAKPPEGHKHRYKPKAHLAVEPIWID
ncbi:hypothetical protein H0H92_004987 [Tricholoma furcatifolium]|nr:hypothetical protein H0H92_004987 [Tricholoma furcatifolium]